MTLDQIGVKNGTDKSTLLHNYLIFYETLFAPLREKQFLMFEIGVFKGASVKTWGEYFPKATIVGMDIDPSTAAYASGNIHIRIADASMLEHIWNVIAEFGRPLIVIDDGSHQWGHQIETLRYLFPMVLPGGIFIEEDIHTSFPKFDADPIWKGASRISTYDYLQGLNRFVVGEGYMENEKPLDQFIATYKSQVSSIEWYRGTCAIKKMA